MHFDIVHGKDTSVSLAVPHQNKATKLLQNSQSV
jgi:hypothetical protein